MTTQNGVLRLFARWVMRVEACRGVLQLGLFGGTFLTTGLTALHQYGHDEWAQPFIGIVGVSIVVFAYVYTESGVWNQKNRDKKDVGTNYSGPNLLMRYQMQGVQLATLFEAMKRDLDEAEMQALLEDRTIEQWERFREGVDGDLLVDGSG